MLLPFLLWQHESGWMKWLMYVTEPSVELETRLWNKKDFCQALSLLSGFNNLVNVTAWREMLKVWKDVCKDVWKDVIKYSVPFLSLNLSCATVHHWPFRYSNVDVFDMSYLTLDVFQFCDFWWWLFITCIGKWLNNFKTQQLHLWTFLFLQSISWKQVMLYLQNLGTNT